jgi:phage head maturation protease
MGDTFTLFGALGKVEEQDDGTLKVYGVASSGARDEAGEIITPDAMRGAIAGYLAYPAIREQHRSDIAAGTALELSVDDAGVSRIVAHAVDPGTVKKVRTKVLRGFSVGGRVLKRDPKDPTIITAIKLNEISLVDRPCNPEASIDLWKADIGEQPMAYAPTNDEVKARAGEMAKTAGKTAMDAFKGYVAKARADLIAEHVEVVPEQLTPEAAAKAAIAWSYINMPKNQKGMSKARADLIAEHEVVPEQLTPEAAAKAAIADELHKVAPTMAEADATALADEIFAANAAAEQAETVEVAVAKALAERGIEAAPVEADPATLLAAALDKAKSKTAPKPYGNVEYADAKNGKYPIDTAAHIRAAWSYINMPKNQKGMSDGEVKAIKGKIVAAWKSKIDPAGPPSAEKTALLGDLAKDVALVQACETVALEKGFYTVGRQAALLAAAADIAMSVVWEEREENDTASTQPQAMLDIVAALHQLVVSGANEETAEFMAAAERAGGDGVALLAPCLEIDLMEMATQLGDLHKADTALMEKVGARNSKTDASHIQAAHDHMTECGATCDPNNCPDPDAGKTALSGDLGKLATDAAETLTKQATQIEDLEKVALGEAERTAAAIEAALEKFRKEPLPPKTAASHLAVTKQQDVNPGAPGLDDTTKAELTVWWAGLTPEQRAMESMKSTMRSPVQAR